MGAVMAGRSACVIIASSRASAGVYEDRCGPLIAEWLAQRGFSSVQTVLVGDGDPVGQSLRDVLAKGVDVVITSGGTGISPSDDTPAQTVAVLDY
jgi:molybdopterin biosynthesis enzyme MoaB